MINRLCHGIGLNALTIKGHTVGFQCIAGCGCGRKAALLTLNLCHRAAYP